MRKRLAIVASHVIQYQDPFFRLLAADPEIDLTVLYLSDQGARAYRDTEMGTTLQWDLDLLHGYRYEFLRNLGWGAESFVRRVNPGLIPALMSGRFDAVLFQTGWGMASAWIGFEACAAAQVPFLLFGDSSFPPPETTFRARLRAQLLRALFRRAAGFMITGTRNAEYYAHYGADRRRFFPLPFAVDNDRFALMSRVGADERRALRARYGIGNDAVVILFSAKLVPRKEPMTLLRAFQRMRRRGRAALLFVGDGPLRPQLEAAAGDDVAFAGFVNQTEMPKLYGISDVFVLPSTFEPLGLAVNEAMACGLPVVVSERVGIAADLVRDNGRIVPAGDEVALAAALDEIAGDDALRDGMGARSRQIIAPWSFAAGVEGVKAALRAVTAP
jgi:glycosyltransferase involved in cell wall biosynthesis